MISRGPTSLSRDFPGTQPAVNGSHRAGISPRPLRDAFPHPLTKEAFSRWPPLSAVRPDRYFFPSQRFLYYMHFPPICKPFFRRGGVRFALSRLVEGRLASAFFRRGGVRFALLRLGKGRLVSARGVVPGRELPSALGHNEDVFGPAFFKKLAERETASRDLIRLPKRRRGNELSRRGRLTGEPSPGVPPFFRRFSSSRRRSLRSLAVGGGKVGVRVGGGAGRGYSLRPRAQRKSFASPFILLKRKGRAPRGPPGKFL